MNEQEALKKMVAPGTRRPGKFREGVIQIWVTRACDKACFGCTQGSNLGGKTEFMSLEHFDQACASLKGYFGVIGMFGGNPATHPEFAGLCEIMRRHFPKEQRGLWCNNIRTRQNANAARETFEPRVSNLNVHLDSEAYLNFKTWWPESMPFGLDKDSRHSPPYVAMKDVLRKDCAKCQGSGYSYRCPPGCKDPNCPGDQTCVDCCGTGKVYDESKAWELISGCDINQHWSAMIGVFRGQLRAWFCEIAGAQAMLHQWDKDHDVDSTTCKYGDDPQLLCTCWTYPDTGVDPTILHQRSHTGDGLKWWECGMHYFIEQVRRHCHSCGVPLRGKGQLAIGGDFDANAVEQVSATHQGVYNPKRKSRRVELITVDNVTNLGHVDVTTHYLQNAKK